MPYEYFSAVFFEDMWFNLFLIFMTISVVLFIYKKYIYSLYDPLFFFLIFSSAGYSVVFILFFSGHIATYYLIHFILTQLSLIIGFLLFKPVNFKKLKKPDSLFYLRITQRVKIIYYISGVLYIFSHLVLYIIKGIPLFMHSRLDATTGGFGFILSISSTTIQIVLSILSYKYLLGFKFKFFDYVMSFSFVLFSLLSGSKSIFIGVVFILFYVAYFLSVKLSIPQIINKFNKIAKNTFILAVLSLFFLLFFIKNMKVMSHIVCKKCL